MWVGWAVAQAATVEGYADPLGYQLALSQAIQRVVEDHPELEAVSFRGSAQGAPLLGPTVQLRVTWTCGGQERSDELLGVRGRVGETDWRSVAEQAVTMWAADLSCGGAAAVPQRPERISGYANPQAYQLALELALARELEARPGITAVEFRASSRGVLVMGPAVRATATFTCGGREHEVSVDGIHGAFGEGSWSSIADVVVSRLLRELSCDAP